LNSGSEPLTAVVCRTYQQFRAWCYDNNRNPRDPSLRLVMEEQHARGCWFDDVVLIDGRPGLMEMTQTRIRRSSGITQEQP
jgi:hypothetical protein